LSHPNSSKSAKRLSLAAIPAAATLQKMVANICTSGSSFPWRFVPISPALANDQNGKNDEKCET